MGDIADYILMAARVVACIPLYFFIRTQLRFINAKNGEARMVRQVTLLMSASTILLVLNLIAARIEIMAGIDIRSNVNDFIFIAITILWGGANWLALVQFRKIQNSHADRNIQS